MEKTSQKIAAAASVLCILSASPARAAGTPITQGTWARMLVERMAAPGHANANIAGDTAGNEATKILGARSPEIVRDGRSALPGLSDGKQKTWRYEITVPKTGMYLLSARNAGPAFIGVDKQPTTLTAAARQGQASDVGRFPLGAGTHTVFATLAQNFPAPEISLVSGCGVISPAGGWAPNAPLDRAVLARTLVQATRQGGRLPAQEAGPIVAVKAAKVSVSVPSEGTFTVLLSGRALANASYRLDGCESTPLIGAPTADGWREGSTVLLEGGEHVITLSGVDVSKADGRIRLVRRSAAEKDQLAVLAGLGVTIESKATAGRVVVIQGKTITAEEAEQILSTPAIARLLGGGFVLPGLRSAVARKDEEDDDARSGTFPEVVSPVLPASRQPDPL